MDKTTSPSTFLPPRSDLHVSSSRTAAFKREDLVAGIQARSFESALERVRNQKESAVLSAEINPEPDDTDSLSRAVPDVQNDNSISTKYLTTEGATQTESGQIASVGENALQRQNGSMQSSSLANQSTTAPNDPVAGISSSATQSQTSDAMANTKSGTVEGVQQSVHDSVQGLSSLSSPNAVQQVELHPGPGSNPTFHGAMTAENVSLLMARLERMPTGNDGKWNFSVLNDPAGVSTLHFERAEQGGWHVNVAFESSAQLEEMKLAEQLKTALQEQGHEVDSVTLSHDSAESIQDDD